MRLDWDEYFLQQAEHAAKQATCNRLHVGCVIVRDRRTVATGFNGSLPNHPHCTDAGCLTNEQGRCIRTIHAENNALLQCAKYGIPTEGATAYVTHTPCEQCTKQLVMAGITRVVFRHEYNNPWNNHFRGNMAWVCIPPKEETS